MEIINKHGMIIVEFSSKDDLANNLSEATKRLSRIILFDEMGDDDDY